MQYWVYMERRTQITDKKAELEHQCFNLFPERWGALYRDQILPPGVNSPGDTGMAFGGAPEAPVTATDDLDAWYEGREATRRMSGAETEPFERITDWMGGEV